MPPKKPSRILNSKQLFARAHPSPSAPKSQEMRAPTTFSEMQKQVAQAGRSRRRRSQLNLEDYMGSASSDENAIVSISTPPESASMDDEADYDDVNTDEDTGPGTHEASTPLTGKSFSLIRGNSPSVSPVEQYREGSQFEFEPMTALDLDEKLRNTSNSESEAEQESEASDSIEAEPEPAAEAEPESELETEQEPELEPEPVTENLLEEVPQIVTTPKVVRTRKRKVTHVEEPEAQKAAKASKKTSKSRVALFVKSSGKGATITPELIRPFKSAKTRGLRKSTRVRVQPLQWYRGQKAIYKINKFGTFDLVGIESGFADAQQTPTICKPWYKIRR